MPRARGILRNVRSRKGESASKSRSKEDEGTAGEGESSKPVGKGYRGRGRGRPPNNPKKESENEEQGPKVFCVSFPVTERDEEEVECKLCSLKTTFREFRIHNIQMHSNIATTSDDPTIPEHKYYERRLKELCKLTKIIKFHCPTKDCGASYKSALGLAYHLETCGKTKEEIEACLIPCDQCDEKFTLPNLAWHKKAKHTIREDDDETSLAPSVPSAVGKRKSAIKARAVMQEAVEDLADDTEKMSFTQTKIKKIDKDDEEWDIEANSSDMELPKPKSADAFGKAKPQAQQKIGSTGSKINSTVPSGKGDFPANAIKFMSNKLSPDSYWDEPTRVEKETFPEVKCNSWNAIPTEFIPEYLPKQTESVTFKTEVETKPHPAGRQNTITNDYRKLPWFTGDLIDDYEGNLVFNVGGPVFGISWHPSGKFLAVSTGNDSFEELDYKKIGVRKACIQIYSHEYEIKNESKKKTIQKDSKPIINSLTLQLIICIDYGYVTHLQWGSFWPTSINHFCVGEASFNDNVKMSDRVGDLAVCCEDGDIRIYVLQVEDFKKKANFSPDNRANRLSVYKKVPEICLRVEESLYPHRGQVCRFEWHEQNRFLIAGYSSGVVALFDLETRSNLLRDKAEENGENVVIFSPFWVFQGHVSPVTGVHFDPMNPRYFATASKDRYLKIWDMDFRQEIECRKVGLVVDTCWIRGWMHVAVSVDASISNLSSQHNFVRFYQIGHSQGRSNCAEYMDISSLTFYNGITIQGTEHGNLTATYFDYFWRECDYDRNKKKQNVVNICKINVDPTSFEPIEAEDFSRSDESFVPFTFKQEEPRIILTFFKERIRSQLNEPTAQSLEDYVRFSPFIRINKVTWCPIGRCFATGYRSGLLTIVPASFESLYGN